MVASQGILAAKEFITDMWERKPSLKQSLSFSGGLPLEQQLESGLSDTEKMQLHMDDATSNETARTAAADRAFTAAWESFADSFGQPGLLTLAEVEGGRPTLTALFMESTAAKKDADRLFAASLAAKAAGQYEYAVTLAEEAILRDEKANPIFNKYYAYTWDREPERKAAYIHDVALLTVQFGEQLNLEQLERLREYHASAGTEFFGEMVLDPLNLIPNVVFEKGTAAILGKLSVATSKADDFLKSQSSIYRYLNRLATSSAASKIKSDWYDIITRWADAYSTRKELVGGMDTLQAALHEAAATSDDNAVRQIFEHYKTLPGGGGIENMSFDQFKLLRSHYNDVSGPAAVARSEAAQKLNAELQAQKKYGLSREDGYIPGDEYGSLFDRSIMESEEAIRARVIKDHPELLRMTDDAARTAAIDSLVEKTLGTAWSNDVGIAKFADTLSESFIDQHRIYKGSRLLDDTVAGMATRWLKETGRAELSSNLIEASLAWLWKARDSWVKVVLLTPRWLVNNLIDSTSRMFIYGASPLGGLSDVLFGIRHQFTDELGHIPMEFAQSLARSDLGFEETVAARALYEGWTPNLFQNSFWKYEYRRLKDAEAVAAKQIANYPPGLKGTMSRLWNGWKLPTGLQAIPGAMVDFNTYVEFALRLRLFHKRYFTMIRALEPGFKGLAMADVPESIRPVADLIWRNSEGVPSKIRAYTNALTGKSGSGAVFNLLVPPEVEASLMAATADDQQNFVVAIVGQLQEITKRAHMDGRDPTANEFVKFFDDFTEKFRIETETIMGENLALREATGNINVDKVAADVPTQETLKGAAPISGQTSRQTEAIGRIKTRKDKISRTLLTDFKEAVTPFASVETVPGKDILVVPSKRGLVIQVGDQVELSTNVKAVRGQLNTAVKESLWHLNQDEILSYNKFASQEDFVAKLDKFIDNPAASFVDDANASFFFSRELSRRDDLRDVLEALHGKKIPYEDSNALWEMYGRDYDVMTETGAAALIARDHRLAEDILPAPPEYADIAHKLAESSRRLGDATRTMKVPPDLARNISDFLSRRSLAMSALKDYFTFVFPGPRSVKVGMREVSRQARWGQWYDLAIEEFTKLVDIETDLAVKLENRQFDEVVEYIESWFGDGSYQDFNLKFLNSVGVHPIMGSDGITVLGVTFDFSTKKNFEPYAAKVKEGLQARFFVPKNGEVINSFRSMRWKVRQSVGEDAANALYATLYSNLGSKSPQADAWVDVITTHAVEWGQKAGRTPDEYLRRLGIIDGKIVDEAAFAKWAVSRTNDGVNRGFLFGMGGANVPDMLRLSSEHYLRDLNLDGVWHKNASRELEAVRDYVEAVTGIEVKEKWLPEHVQAFAEAVFKEQARYTYKAGHLPPSLLRQLKKPTGENARTLKRMLEAIDKSGMQTDEVVLAILKNGDVELVLGRRQILDAIQAKDITQLPVTVIHESNLERAEGKTAFNLLLEKFEPFDSRKHKGMHVAVNNYKAWLANIRRSIENSPAVEKGLSQDVIQFLNNLVKQEDLIPPKKSMVREMKLVAEQFGIPTEERMMKRIINDYIRRDEAKASVAIPPASPGIVSPMSVVDTHSTFDELRRLASATDESLESLIAKFKTTPRPFVENVFRGTGRKVPVDAGFYGKGTYYSTLEPYAATYAVGLDNVVGSQVRLANPFYATDEELFALGKGVYDKAIAEGGNEAAAVEARSVYLRSLLEGQGYDGVVVDVTRFKPEVQDMIDEWNMLEPSDASKKMLDISRARYGDNVVEAVSFAAPPTKGKKAKAAVAVTPPIQEFKAVLYRGTSPVTPVDFGWFGKGQYWTLWEETAEGYAKNAPGGKVVSKQIRLQNPYVVNDVSELRKIAEDVEQVAYASMYGPRGALKRKHITLDEINELISNTIRERVEAQGYDGIIINKTTPEQRQMLVDMLDDELKSGRITKLEYSQELGRLDRFETSTEVIVFHPDDAVSDVPTPSTGITNLGEMKDTSVAYAAFLDYAQRNGLAVPQETIDQNVSLAWEVYKRVRGWTDGFDSNILRTPDTFYEHLRSQMNVVEGEMYEQYRFYLWQIEQFRDKAISSQFGSLYQEFINPAPMEMAISDGQKQWIRANDYAISNFERLSNTLDIWKQYMVDMAKGKHVALRPYTKEDISALNSFSDVATKQKAELVGTTLHGGNVDGRGVQGSIAYVNKIMLDYQTRNNFDQLMKNFFPFWMFPSRSLPFWAETMMLHPELVAFYNKYKSMSRTFRYQEGAMNSKGDPLPRLDGYVPIYFPGVKDPIWFNPIQPLSFRYVFTPIEQLEDLEVNSRYNEKDMPPLAYVVRELDESSRVYGFSVAPWILWTVKSFGNIDDNIMPQFPIAPEISLIPRWAAIDMLYMARRRSLTFPGYENVPLSLKQRGPLPEIDLYPEVPWHNYLVEKQLLLNAKARADQSNWSDEQKIKYYQTVRDAIAQKGDNPMWQETYRQVTTDEAQRSWVSFFTGFYPKEFSTAEADMFRVRNDIYALQQSMNNDVMIELFDRPTDFNERYAEYVEFLQTPNGFLNSLYSDIGYITNHKNQVIYEPQERSKTIAANIDQEVKNEEYYQAIAAAQERRDAKLFALPIGAPFEQTSPIWEQYFSDIERAEAQYDPKFDFYGSNKPIERILEDISNEWYRMIYTTRPRWNKDRGETYEEYQARYLEWETRLPQIAELGSRSWTRSTGTKVSKIIANLRADKGQIIPDEFWKSLYANTNAAAMQTWRKKNDTIFDALNGAWDELYWSPFWAAVKDKKGYERQLAEQDFLAAHPQPPTDEEMYAWIRTEYGDRFTIEDVKKFASGTTEYTVQNRLDYGITETEKLRDSIWDMLSWVAPGKARDLLQEQFVLAGGDRDTISSWYNSSGVLYQGSPEEAAQLTAMQAQIQQALVSMKATPPTRPLLLEYIQAQSEQEVFKSSVEKELGKDFWTAFNYYNELESGEKRQYRSQSPDNYKRIQDYYQMRDAYALVNPIWAKYYYTATTTGGSGGGGGGSSFRSYGGGGFGGSGGGGGGGSSGFPQALSYNFRTAGGTAGLLARYVASLPPSFAQTVSSMAVQDMAAAAFLGAAMPASTAEYLSKVAVSHPEWKSTIDTAIKATP